MQMAVNEYGQEGVLITLSDPLEDEEPMYFAAGVNDGGALRFTKYELTEDGIETSEQVTENYF